MAPRPKTYGARRSQGKPSGGLVNGTTADKSEHELKMIDVMSTRTKNGKEKDLGTAQKEDEQNILSQGLKEDELASGKPSGDFAALERTHTVEDKSTTVSPVPWSLRNKRVLAQDMLPPDTPAKEHGSRRKSSKKSVDGSATSQNQGLITSMVSQSILTDHPPSSYAKSTFHPNDLAEDHQQSPVDHSIDLNNKPSEIHNLAAWIAQLIRKCHQDKNLSSIITEPTQKDSKPQIEQDIEMIDALENVDDVRMTRGREKKRLQQLKGKGSANGNDLSGKFVTGVGTSLSQKNAAPVERLLKDQLNNELKQRLFGSSNTTDVSANMVERNACGTLLFNAIVDAGVSGDHNSATVLRSALEERQDDAPFVSALKILASSSEVMEFINLLFSKDDAPQWEASNADESRPSTGAETSGGTTITESSGPTSHAGTSMSNVECVSKIAALNGAMDNRNAEKQKRSQAVIQALEAASAILVQIQQGEAGINYVTPYAGGGMFPSPVGQRQLNSYGTAYGPPYHNPPIHAMSYGPSIGPNLNTYASPYVAPQAPHPDSYASPYPNPVNQPPAHYASPYANPMISNQTNGIGLVSSGNTQINNHDVHKTYHHKKEAHQSNPDVTGTKTKKGNDEAASQLVSRETQDTRPSSKEADEAGIGNGEEEKRKASDEATRQGISDGKEVAGNVIDLDEINVDDVKKQQGGDEDNGTSSDHDLTDDDLSAVKPDDKNITPPADDHKLFTGERLGDFSSTESIDWLLTMSNGGKVPRPSKKRRTRSPSISPPSQADEKVQMESSRIIDEITLYRDWLGHPGATLKQLFYASAEAQRLAAELRRLMAIAKPVVNTIMPLAESQARLRFYQQLESRAIKEKRDREVVQQGMHRFYGPPMQIQQWVPPPPALGRPIVPLPRPAPLPSNVPMEVPFVRRGNVIAAPPGGRNIEEEKKAETYGYPPMPGSRPGDSDRGQKRKKGGRQ